jgi:hypothetical protein
MGDCLGQARHNEISWRVALGDRCHDDRGHKCERREQADVALAQGFVIGDLGEDRDTTNASKRARPWQRSGSAFRQH